MLHGFRSTPASPKLPNRNTTTVDSNNQQSGQTTSKPYLVRDKGLDDCRHLVLICKKQHCLILIVLQISCRSDLARNACTTAYTFTLNLARPIRRPSTCATEVLCKVASRRKERRMQFMGYDTLFCSFYSVPFSGYNRMSLLVHVPCESALLEYGTLRTKYLLLCCGGTGCYQTCVITASCITVRIAQTYHTGRRKWHVLRHAIGIPGGTEDC